MKRIVIYVHNAEQEELRPLAKRLEKMGILINWHALKFPEVVKADQVLTFRRYIARVEEIFAGTGIPVVAIEDADENTPALVEEPVIDGPSADVAHLSLNPAIASLRPEDRVELTPLVFPEEREPQRPQKIVEASGPVELTPIGDGPIVLTINAPEEPVNTAPVQAYDPPEVATRPKRTRTKT